MKKGFFTVIGIAMLGATAALAQTPFGATSNTLTSKPAPATLPAAKLGAPMIDTTPAVPIKLPDDVTAPAGQPVVSPEPAVQPPATPAAADKPAAASTSTANIWNNVCGGCCQQNCDNRVSLSADYLLWWIRKGPTGGPLLTTGSPNDPIQGALGQPNTQVIFGDGAMGYGTFSGLRLNASVDVMPGLAVEGNYFVLERRSVNFTAGSNATGSPLIARPFVNDNNGLQESYFTSFPGFLGETTTIASHTQLQGFEVNFAGNLDRSATRHLDVILGYRYLNLREDLIITDSLSPLQPGFLTFLGNPVNPPSMVTDFDGFSTRNHFNGGQVGARWQQTFGKLDVSVTGKLALGVTDQHVSIDGNSTLFTPGAAPVTVPGGILAQPSNMGTYSRSVFSVVPEVGLNLGWQISPRLSTTVGYTFLYWTGVARPGDQTDRRINTFQVPTDQNFAPGVGNARPAFAFHSSDFWAQGVNFGMTFRF